LGENMVKYTKKIIQKYEIKKSVFS
jgi:hypothetical protein